MVIKRIKNVRLYNKIDDYNKKRLFMKAFCRYDISYLFEKEFSYHIINSPIIYGRIFPIRINIRTENLYDDINHIVTIVSFYKNEELIFYIYGYTKNELYRPMSKEFLNNVLETYSKAFLDYVERINNNEQI